MKSRDLAKKLSRQGCREVPRTGDGSHRKWLNPATGSMTVIPDKGGDDLKLGTVRGELWQLGIDRRVFDRA